MRRSLSLKKETLAELSPRELGDVAGAQATPTCPAPTYALTCFVPTDHCQTVNYACLSQLMDPCLTYTCV